MHNPHSYYSATTDDFLRQSEKYILGVIHSNNSTTETTIQQSNTWVEEINILKQQLKNFSDGYLIFEYIIPRMGKRVDAIFLYKNIVFILEFKCGDKEYRHSTYDQVYDYALDLRNFQKESHNKLLVPIMISTAAPCEDNKLILNNKIIEPLKCNSTNIESTINLIANKFIEKPFDYIAWENSEYLPTPTIVEAAQALYRGHNVSEITRNDAGAKNLTITTNEINKIIEYSKTKHRKSICFVTGVPGAGKTLVGLNIAIQRSDAQKGEHAVFLSGNQPLVTVLQEALARDKVEQDKSNGKRLSKLTALRSTSAFIQIIHKYRDSFVDNNNLPPERIAIFDEAQRAWTHEKISNFMSTKKGKSDFPYSEPEFLISTMNRHSDWAVIICLVGGGQEINTGEAGLPEWFDSLRKTFPNWDVYTAPKINDDEYRMGQSWDSMIEGLRIFQRDELHLSTSMRSFRTPDLSAFIKSVLDTDITSAKTLFHNIKYKYPIVITRDLKKGKQWVINQCPGTTRYGLLASSRAQRLKPEGIFVKNEISVANWFLNPKGDVRSSYALEDVATEFEVQGLELDYSIIAWDADFRFDGQKWTYYIFSGTKWNKIHSLEKQAYLKNTYRVLLTRARQGMVIFVPHGSSTDITRKSEYYDKTYQYLKDLGLKEL